MAGAPALVTAWRSPSSFAARVVAVVCVGLAVSIGCSSSDDVVAVFDAPTPAPVPGATVAGGSPLVSVRAGREAAASPPAPTASELSAPSAGVPGGVGVSMPAAVPSSAGLHVSGAPMSAPVADAEAWPIARPLREFFPPALAHEPAVVVVGEPDAPLLRELGVRYGLGEGLPPVHVQVEDELGDQFEIVLWEE